MEKRTIRTPAITSGRKSIPAGTASIGLISLHFRRVHNHPLDAMSVAVTLPAMCEHELTATWDQGSCAWDPRICEIPI